MKGAAACRGSVVVCLCEEKLVEDDEPLIYPDSESSDEEIVEEGEARAALACWLWFLRTSATGGCWRAAACHLREFDRDGRILAIQSRMLFSGHPGPDLAD